MISSPSTIVTVVHDRPNTRPEPAMTWLNPTFWDHVSVKNHANRPEVSLISCIFEYHCLFDVLIA